MMKNKNLFIILFLLVFLFLAGCSGGGIPTTPTDPIHNLTKGIYYATIQDALDDADNDNTIEVSDGTYDESIYFSPGKKIILRSVNGPSSTIIRGADYEYTVNLESSLAVTTIEGFTITHAPFQYGGGIYNDLVSSLIINHCIIFGNNNGDYGGGIHNRGIITLKGGSTASDNFTSYGGGGIYNFGTLTITGASSISSNTAYESGGGIQNSETLTITGVSTVSDNYSNFCGGGIDNSGELTVTGESTISGNTADYGGGIENTGTLTINGASIISDNNADVGGGIRTEGGSSLNMTASTIWGNSADSNGGGIYMVPGGNPGAPVIGGSSADLKNTICGNFLSGNSPSLDQQIRDSSGDLYNICKLNNNITTYCIGRKCYHIPLCECSLSTNKKVMKMIQQRESANN